MKNKVFLSYAAEDRRLAQRVKVNLGKILSVDASAKSKPLEIFDVQSKAIIGGDIRKAIKTAMSAADTVVVVASPNVDRSEWMNYEAGLADAMGKNVVIVGPRNAGSSALLNRFGSHAKFVEVSVEKPKNKAAMSLTHPSNLASVKRRKKVSPPARSFPFGSEATRTL